MYSSIYINGSIGQNSHLLVQQYHDALVREIDQSDLHSKHQLETVYFDAHRAFGRDFTWLLDTSGTLRKTVTFAQNAEISLEIGQKPIFEEQVRRWHSRGITRVVLRYDEDNSMQFELLEKSIALINRYITNISIDLYVCTPELIKKIVMLPIKHIALYAVSGFSQARREIGAAGFYWYEWQHFAKPGFESVFMRQCWARRPYKGFGVGACSFADERRTKNESDVEKYIQKIQTEGNAIVEHEQLTEQERYIEIITMQLRKPQGVCKQLLSDDTKQKITSLIEQKLLLDHGATIGYTDRGFLLENQIITKII